MFLTRSFNWSHVKCINIASLKKIYAHTAQKQTTSRQPDHEMKWEESRKNSRRPAQISINFWEKKYKIFFKSYKK